MPPSHGLTGGSTLSRWNGLPGQAGQWRIREANEWRARLRRLTAHMAARRKMGWQEHRPKAACPCLMHSTHTSASGYLMAALLRGWSSAPTVSTGEPGCYPVTRPMLLLYRSIPRMRHEDRRGPRGRAGQQSRHRHIAEVRYPSARPMTSRPCPCWAVITTLHGIRPPTQHPDGPDCPKAGGMREV